MHSKDVGAGKSCVVGDKVIADGEGGPCDDGCNTGICSGGRMDCITEKYCGGRSYSIIINIAIRVIDAFPR